MALLLIIYLAFISLGLPDGVLGSIWPVMRASLDLPLYAAGIVGAIGSIGTVISALSSYRLIHRFGTGKVTLVSVLLTALALLGFSISSSLPALMLCSIPLGLGAGSVDSALNNYVALHYKARHMNWLHSFWGLGASSGPAVMGLVLSLDLSYRMGYRILGGMQLVLVLALFFSLALWQDGKHRVEGEPEVKPVPAVHPKKGALLFALLGFFLYCALEISTGMWAVSYLVEVKGLEPAQAAFYGSLFFLGITSGRMASGFFSYRLSNTTLIFSGFFLIMVSIGLLHYSTLATAGLSLLLMGIGCAPIFPGMIHETPNHFGRENSQKIIGLQMASAYTGSTISPPLFGILGNWIGLAWMPLMQLVLLILLASSVALLFGLGRKRSS
ncbi:Inner membrane protein YbjJ [bioreactor metagenome]|uniref:Inner membrane protein YbjJ n=1 Tax=bioreactor metagenome TaxID=1076179 RepID=A0A645AJA4_9ZZZZ|nr:MFS transporter [Sphaerochaeta sp.]